MGGLVFNEPLVIPIRHAAEVEHGHPNDGGHSHYHRGIGHRVATLVFAPHGLQLVDLNW